MCVLNFESPLCGSVEAVLRERGAPIPVRLLGATCPFPEGVFGKLTKVLADDGRFDIQDLRRKRPMVRLHDTEAAAAGATNDQETPWEADAATRDAAERETLKTWLKRCVLSLELRSMIVVEPR